MIKLQPLHRLLPAISTQPTLTHKTDTQVHLEIFAGGAGKVAGLLQQADPALQNQAYTYDRLFFDTDKTGLEHLPKKQGFVMNDFPATEFLEEVEKNPDRVPDSGLEEKVEEYFRALGGSESLAAGLQTARVLGWLVMVFYLYRYLAELTFFLLAPMRRLHRYGVELCTRRNGHSNIQDRLWTFITLAFGSGGGTGSSIGLLLADILHHLLPQRGGFSRFALEADLFLPGPLIHQAHNAQLLLANTWAMLLELRQRYLTRCPDLRIGPLTIKRRRPFQHIYLFDDINLGGHVFKNRQEVAQMRNAGWQLRSLGPEGAEYRARLVDYYFEAPAVFSALGACIWVYEPEQVITDVSYRTAAQTARDLVQPLLPDEVQTRAQERVTGFLNRYPVIRELPALTNDASGKPLRATLDKFVSYPRQQVPQTVGRFLQRTLENRQCGFNELATAAATERSQAVIAEVEEICNLRGGFDIAQAFIQQLLILVEELRTPQQRQIDRAFQQHARLKQQAERSPNSIRRFSLAPRRRYLTERQRILDNEIDLLRQRARMQVLDLVVRDLNHLLESCQEMRATLSELAERMVAERVTFLQEWEAKRSIAVHSVLCPEDVDAWYSAGEVQALRQVREGLHITWFADEGRLGLLHTTERPTERRVPILSLEGLRRYLNLCQQPWLHLGEKSVEDILQEQGRTPEAVYTEMEKDAAPLVALHEVRQIPAAKRLLILGSETTTFFKDLPTQTGLSVVATGNRQRISLLYTIHGLDPCDHLRKSDDFRRAYEQALAEGRSLHVYPDFAPQSDTEHDAPANHSERVNHEPQ